MGPLLLLAFLIVPVVEIYVIIQVGQAIGALPTVVLLLVDGVVGAALVRREGAKAWRAFQAAMSAGRMPTKEIADGALIMLGGALLLAPGFVTDGIGLLFVLPFTRPLVRRFAVRLLGRRSRFGTVRAARRPRQSSYGDVIEGEVVEQPPPDDNPPGAIGPAD